MRIAIAESNFKTNIPLEPQELLSIRASIEILQSIRVFDRASARLVETTNKLTRLGVALAAVGAVLGVAALWISCLGYRLALSQVGK
jgi:hypothetical protein